MARRLAIPLVLAMTIAGGCGGGVHTTPAPTVDPSIALALAPACVGQGVSAAGRVATGGNHLVVLDEMGNELHMVGQFANETKPSEFPWHEPAHWIPGTLADAELVACIQPADSYTLLQTCSYSMGMSSIQRFGAAREVRVVEASTGRLVKSLSLTENARECMTREDGSITALYGVITDDDVWQALEGVVANGTMYE
jgi:hypothetical protein